MNWRDHAACRDLPRDSFFGPAALRSRAVCARCPVADDCLTAALTAEAEQGYAYGVRGGLTARQRRAMLDARRRLAGHLTGTRS